MCGLAGLVFGADPKGRLESTLKRLHHRGPDGQRVWSDEHAWLAHTRLRILDTTEAADQPMTAPEGRGVLLYNGEVYNYRELAAQLGSDWRPRSSSDTEVVFEWLLREGAAALERFNGMWALALWRPREKTLLLARDRFGVKPLYLAEPASGGLAFASEIPALRSLVGGFGEPDRDVVRRFVALGEAEPRERTFFAGVRKLPAGHFAEVGPQGARIERYWDLRRAVALTTPPREPAAAYRDALRDAVQLRLRSDVPVGTCLSGGIDSSSIVCMVRRLADDGVAEPTLTYKAFSARHPGTTSDEGGFIDAVLAHTSFDGHAVVPGPEGLAADLEALVRYQGEPFGSLGVYSQFCVMRLARERGVTVLLDGQGADEVLAGYPMYAHYRLADLVRRGRLAQGVRLARGLARVQGWPLGSLARAFGAALLPSGLRGRARGRALVEGGARFLSGDLRAGLEPGGSVDDEGGDRFTSALLASIEDQGLPSLLRYEDRNSMAFSIEARVPFLDWRLVVLGLSLPAEMKLHDGWTKWVLREAMAPDLPSAVRWRRDKKAFATPQAQWLSGPLAGWAREILGSATLRERGWFDDRRLVSEYEGWLRGGPAIDSELWRVLSVELWARTLAEDGRAA